MWFVMRRCHCSFSPNSKCYPDWKSLKGFQTLRQYYRNCTAKLGLDFACWGTACGTQHEPIRGCDIYWATRCRCRYRYGAWWWVCFGHSRRRTEKILFGSIQSPELWAAVSIIWFPPRRLQALPQKNSHQYRSSKISLSAITRSKP